MMRIRIKKNNLIKTTPSDLMYFVAYGIFLVFSIMDTSFYTSIFGGTLYKFAMVIVMIVLLFREFYINKVKINTIILAVACFLLFIICNIYGTISFSIMFLIMWCSRNVKFNNIAKFSLVITSICLFIIVISSKIGLITNYTSVRASNGVLRHYLGFRYALNGPAYLYNIITLYLYLYKDKIKNLQLIFLFILNYWFYKQTDARLSFYLTLIVLLIGILLKYFPNIFKNKRIIQLCMIYSFFICLLLTVFVSYKYTPTNGFLYKLNKVLANRIYLSNLSLSSYGFKIFGQEINFVGYGLDRKGNVSALAYKAYNYVDSAYISILQKFGVISLILIIICFTVTQIKCKKNNDLYLLVILFLMATRMMIDDLIIYLFYNTFILAVSAKLE